MGWKEKEYEFFFTAAGTTSSLLFQSLTNGFYGPAIDNVSASAVPVPGPAWMRGGWDWSGWWWLSAVSEGKISACCGVTV